MRILLAAVTLLLLAACQYGYDLKADDREVINCATTSDCADGEGCRGIVSEDEGCTADGYLRISDDKAGTAPFGDEASLYFFCHESRRFFPYCVDDQVTACEDIDPCSGDQLCASPIGGGTADCVEPAEPSTTCTSDGDCATGFDCYTLFVVESAADDNHTESICADCTNCIF